jgi:hypothetical protein
MKKSNETWSSYLANPNVRPKTYNVTLRRNRNGEFEVVGGGAFMEHNTGGSVELVRVDARDLARAIRNNGVTSK